LKRDGGSTSGAFSKNLVKMMMRQLLVHRMSHSSSA